jgi:tripartite-type tricarboxylate transporter receptor subunit TctC
MRARALLVAAVLAAAFIPAFIPSGAHAQAWPSKPMRLILPFAPGGPVDLVARTVGPKFSERVGQPVIIENRAGAAGNIGADYVLKSAPDGYTLLYVVSGFATNPFFFKGSPEPAQSIGVIHLLNTPLMMLKSNAFGPTTVPEIMAAIRARPGSVSCASSGALPTVGCELLRSHAKTDMIMVLYKGNAPALQALVGGEVNLLFDVVNTAIPQVKTGRVKAVAAAGQKRMAAFPDLPTVAETLPDFYFEGWHGVVLPLGTPRDIVQRMNRELAAVMELPEVRAPLLGVGFETVGGSPEEFDRKMRGDFARFGKLLTEAGIKPE